MLTNKKKNVIVIGAGINGASSAIWLTRAGCNVTLLDRQEPGEGTSYGNAGLLASCAIAPVTTPGLASKAPKLLLDPNYPLFLRWSYLPRLLPWLIKYLGHANDKDTRRIAEGLTHLLGDSVEQHSQLATGTKAEKYLIPSDYGFAYTDRAALEADSYIWELRKNAGFVPELLEGPAAREYEPGLAETFNLLAIMKNHGYISNPGNYVKALVDTLKEMGGRFVQAEVKDFEMTDGRITAVATDQGRMDCDTAVLTTGVWSKPLCRKLGLSVPLESERGYHIVFKNPNIILKTPFMITSGKFVATSMEMGLRCAGIVEFGGLEAEASKAPLDFMIRKVRECLPNLTYTEMETWMGHRPATTDSLPLIGEVRNSGIYTAFGHQHVGLTGGPKSGRLVADLIAQKGMNVDVSAFSPNRFSR